MSTTIEQRRAMGGRDRLLVEWLVGLGLKPVAISAASEDASFRRYLRLHFSDHTLIAMDAPPEHEACEPFIRIAGLFGQSGLHVPHIHHADTDLGLLLLEDFGDRQLLGELSAESVDSLYGDALAALATLQLNGPGSDRLPPYDHQLLARELSLFNDWLIERHLGIHLDPGQQALLETTYATLIDNALAQPQVAVHRDYHSRNLMHISERTPGIIDFQDAVYGPVTYDLVSLLRDCYIAWPADQVDHWAEQHRMRLIAGGMGGLDDRRQFMVWFDLMGIQRHLKAAGIFARLHHRDHKSGFLADIPRTLHYIVEVCRRHPSLHHFGQLIGERVIPTTLQTGHATA